MDISSLQRHVKAADLPLEKLTGNPQVSEKDKVAEVSRQFEAVLLRQILSEAQKPVFHSSLNKETATTGIYRDMTTSQLADSISQSKALGLGDTLARQMGYQLKLDKPNAEQRMLNSQHRTRNSDH
jgi:Rod binding domain-containing protein